MAISRYDQIISLIKKHKPQRIVEIGTWNGGRAILMAREALRHSKIVHYTGYDLFETATAQTDKEEFNVKPHHSASAVSKKLHDAKLKGLTFDLIPGNTRETLNRWPPIKPDFAYIDGGHSIETIAGDYAALQYAPVIVLDDYYSGRLADDCDVEKYGCNQLVSELERDSRLRVSILPIKDAVKGGGFTQLVYVVRK
jgi:predicted O-methyltransferase YrrM